jgi:hypothetical protein
MFKKLNIRLCGPKTSREVTSNRKRGHQHPYQWVRMGKFCKTNIKVTVFWDVAKSSLRRRSISTRLQGSTSQKIAIFILTCRKNLKKTYISHKICYHGLGPLVWTNEIFTRLVGLLRRGSAQCLSLLIAYFHAPSGIGICDTGILAARSGMEWLKSLLHDVNFEADGEHIQ